MHRSPAAHQLLAPTASRSRAAVASNLADEEILITGCSATHVPSASGIKISSAVAGALSNAARDVTTATGPLDPRKTHTVFCSPGYKIAVADALSAQANNAAPSSVDFKYRCIGQLWQYNVVQSNVPHTISPPVPRF
jgi:uncharacterized protein (DUF2342 family)